MMKIIINQIDKCNMSRCTINRALFNKAVITVEGRGRYFIKVLYFTLQVYFAEDS